MAAAAAKGWIVVAALSGAIAIAVGAFAAHGLDLSTEAGRKAREWLQTGSHYGLIHALALVAVAAVVVVSLWLRKLETKSRNSFKRLRRSCTILRRPR